jgi:predicted DNA-binding transcriptional regulator YafY
VHLVAYHGNWYVVAFRADQPGPSTFALSRIRALKVASTRLPDPAEALDIPAFLGAFFGITGGEKERKVHLRFSSRVAIYIGERIWHQDQRIIRRRDGSLDLRFTTRGWKELVRWILSWQPDVEVLTPRELRDRIAEKLEQARLISPTTAAGNRNRYTASATLDGC